MRRLDDPALVRAEYADEARLRARQAAWGWARGPEAGDQVVAALAEAGAERVLEAGPGCGELAERMVGELGVRVVAVDQSERMVELTRARGVEALVGDVQALPFPDGAFDAAVAAWVLHHVPDLARAVDELARVLRPGGRLVAVTNGEDTLAELWALLGEGRWRASFTAENGCQVLARRFPRVERLDLGGEVVFPDGEAARAYVAASPTRGHLADRLPPLPGPLVARRRVAVLVADR